MKDISRFTIIGGALAVSLAAAGAQALQVIGAKENDLGGEILLTDDKCGDEWKGRGVIATFPDGRVWTKGCAAPLRPGRVLVEWLGGSASVLSMTGWAPNATDRSLKSFSDAELDMLFVRTAWFEGKGETKPKAKPAPRDMLATPLTAAPMLVDQSRRIP